MSQTNGHKVKATNSERIAQLEHDLKVVTWLHTELSLAVQLLVLNLAIASQTQQGAELEAAREKLLGH